jgi:hypothetical protein
VSKAKRFAFTQGQDATTVLPSSRARVARVQALRRSSATTPQDHTPRRQRSRSAARNAAIRAHS